jgi:hypothetical protein
MDERVNPEVLDHDLTVGLGQVSGCFVESVGTDGGYCCMSPRELAFGLPPAGGALSFAGQRPTGPLQFGKLTAQGSGAGHPGRHCAVRVHDGQ